MALDGTDLKKIEDLFKHQIGILNESLQHKLDIVVEGHQTLNEKVDRLENRLDRLEVRMDRLETKVDGVAADLAAHRTDTEALHGVYRVNKLTTSPSSFPFFEVLKCPKSAVFSELS